MSATARDTAPGLWRHRDFLLLWTGQTVSLVGSEVTLLALPLTAVLALHASAFQMGVLRALQYLPALLIGLFAGVFIDRVRRRPVLMAADLGRAVLLGSIPAAAIAGAISMGYLYGVALLVGTLTILFEVAYVAFLPALVGRDQLVDANGRLEASRSVASILGPGLGGVLVQALTAPIAIAADAVSFLVSVLFLGLLRTPEPRPARSAHRGVRREIAEGLRIVLRHPILRATLMSSGITNFFSAIFNSLYVLYLVRSLGVGPAAIGGIVLVGSFAGLAGAIVAGRVARRIGPGPAILLGMALIGVGGILVPIVPRTLVLAAPLLALSLAIVAMGDSFYNINAVSLRQAITPDRLQGRVTASLRFVIWGAQPFGALLGGALGERLGLRPTLAIAAAGWLLAFAALALSPIRAVRTTPSQLDDASPVAAGAGCR
jgi:MFS family permease